MDFQYQIQDKFPKMYDEFDDDLHSQIVLTNITENFHGGINLEELEALGRQRVKSSVHRYLKSQIIYFLLFTNLGVRVGLDISLFN